MAKDGKEKKAYLIKPDGTRQDFEDRPSFTKAQELIGGYLQLFPARICQPGCTVYADEDGRAKNLPYNAEASKFTPGIKLVGNVLILEGWKTLL